MKAGFTDIKFKRNVAKISSLWLEKQEELKLLKADKCKLKSFKVLVEVMAYNEADMREQLNDFEVEWWCSL